MSNQLVKEVFVAMTPKIFAIRRKDPAGEGDWNAGEYARTYLDALSGLAWRDSYKACALADDERHFGHATQGINLSEWHAFDATRPTPDGDGFSYLGSFPTREQAKQAVQASLGFRTERNGSKALN